MDEDRIMAQPGVYQAYSPDETARVAGRRRLRGKMAPARWILMLDFERCMVLPAAAAGGQASRPSTSPRRSITKILPGSRARDAYTEPHHQRVCMAPFGQGVGRVGQLP